MEDPSIIRNIFKMNAWVPFEKTNAIEKHPKGGGGGIGFLKYFQSQQIQTQYKQDKEIEFREFKLGFIVV